MDFYTLNISLLWSFWFYTAHMRGGGGVFSWSYTYDIYSSDISYKLGGIDKVLNRVVFVGGKGGIFPVTAL